MKHYKCMIQLWHIDYTHKLWHFPISCPRKLSVLLTSKLHISLEQCFLIMCPKKLLTDSYFSCLHFLIIFFFSLFETLHFSLVKTSLICLLYSLCISLPSASSSPSASLLLSVSNVSLYPLIHDFVWHSLTKMDCIFWKSNAVF